MSIAPADWIQRFAREIEGTVMAAGDPAYDRARAAFTDMIDRRPALIVRVVGVDDVITVLNVLGNERAWLGGVIGVLYFGTASLVIVRFGGLLAFMVGSFVSSLLFDVVVSLDSSAWYMGSNVLVLALVVALAGWAFYIATGRRPLAGPV